MDSGMFRRIRDVQHEVVVVLRLAPGPFGFESELVVVVLFR